MYVCASFLGRIQYFSDGFSKLKVRPFICYKDPAEILENEILVLHIGAHTCTATTFLNLCFYIFYKAISADIEIRYMLYLRKTRSTISHIFRCIFTFF